ncbi:protein CLP1 homolog [Caerostris darwini]|uniref:Protein CLP1 homolog n=1 Tax=Caerostris darwini TaxID=1538125 RepID=A0AAV4VC68_9ARAC|nr:protein CLP1 homolog [Caerostris darwini]
MAENCQIRKLEVENELRIFVKEDAVQIKLINGLAEIYGTEMELNKIYKFPVNTSFGIFTWHGCSVEVTGNPEMELARHTTMILNVLLHAHLEERRNLARARESIGPVTLIVGPTDVGKSTLCKILLNYASRLGKRPLFVDLDVGQNSISIPGSIGILTIEKPADIVSGFDAQAVNVYQFGYISPGHNIILYFLLLKHLGQFVQSGLKMANQTLRSSGVIINSCGWVRGYGYDAITFAAMAFEIDTLCVIHEERMFMQLSRDMPSSVNVIFVPKLDGVMERRREQRILSREARVREYFYGPTNQLRPFSFDIQFSELKIFKVISRPFQSNEPAQSLNGVTLNDVILVPVSLGYNLINQVLALSSADNVKEDLMVTDVLGFICIKGVEKDKNSITILSPQPGPLPKKILLMGHMILSERREIH